MRNVSPVLLAACLLAASCASMRPGAKASDARQPLVEAEALIATDPARALAQFDAALASPLLKTEERGRALFGATMLRLWPNPELRDLEKAHALLRDLQAGQAGVAPLAVTAAASWLQEIEGRRTDRQRLEEALASRTAQLEEERRTYRTSTNQSQQQADDAVKAARSDAQLQVRAVREDLNAAYRQLAEARASLAQVRDELAKKDAAIRRLTSRALKQ